MPPAYKDRVLLIVLAITGLLLFASLDGRILWQDEAETALLAKSILKRGVPIAFDGTNVVSQEASKEFVAGSRLPYFVWRWSPWVQFYITAASFALLGPTTLAARLPFAALGLVAVYLTYVFARRLSDSPTIARLSVLYLGTSVPFLLHARQARWCSPAYCLFIGVLLSLEGLAAGRRYAWAAFVTTAVLLFYTNYFVAIGLLASALASLLLVPVRPFPRLRLASAYSAVLLFTIPGIFLFQIINKSKGFAVSSILSNLTYYCGAYFTFVLPVPVLALLVWSVISKSRTLTSLTESTRAVHRLCIISVLYVVYLTLGPWVEFRYLSLLLPIAAVLLAVATDFICRRSFAVGLVLLLVLIATDFMNRIPLGYLGTSGTYAADRFPAAGPISFPFLGFLYEVTHQFDSPESALVRYLNEHAEKSDVVLTTYDDLPLQFYTGLRIAGGLQGRPLPDQPDWLIRRRWIVSGEPGKDHDVDMQIDRLLRTGQYELVKMSSKDHMLGTNPDPKHHLFATPHTSPRLIVLKRKRKPKS